MAHIKLVVGNARKKAFTCHQVKRASAAHVSQPPFLKKNAKQGFFPLKLQTSIVALGGGGAGGSSKQQTVPPSIPIIELYNEGEYPVGEICDYPPVNDGRTAKNRTITEEMKVMDESQSHLYEDMRIAAEAHRQVCFIFYHTWS
ncbi:methionine aminopeptidase 2 [Elysia marginata]|uniref:Methionine aminopeptidase 2 n=1 Tax=Elysia marginata TaxID=1093978 RepID=A0AAV4HGL8_9GAST|nr:methionine aminopeptidase 2 [Elysia marginata]